MTETPDTPETPQSSESAGRNIAPLPGVPVVETANLRSGPELHPELLGLLPLVGIWRGEGEGKDPATGDDYHFSQQVIVSHNGGPFLTWRSDIWVIDDDANFVRADLSETGFWRIGTDDTIELLLAHAEGTIELFYGKPRNLTSWELGTDVVLTSASGVKTGGGTRLYGVVDGTLAYVEERVGGDGELAPHLSAQLHRWGG